ncbi:MAG: excinuclease ABC subunit UvrA [Rikenellaceae bacterium]
MEESNKIIIQGARVHNLKGVDVEIPHNKLVVVTGLSGSGKSTLAFDTIFAEGQRRYVESLSAYARQFLGRVSKPDVDQITGIAPAIAIEQRVNSRNPRSTVGTTTEIYDYMKLLFARVGRSYSPVSGEMVSSDSVDDVVDYILSLEEGERVVITAPLSRSSDMGLVEPLLELMSQGLQRLYVDGEMTLVEEFLPKAAQLTEQKNIDVVFDRVVLRREKAEELKGRFADAVSRAYEYSDGYVAVVTGAKGETIRRFSSCFERDGITFEEPSEHLFSFNNPLGACPKCEGYGKVVGIDEELVVPDKSKTIYENAIACWRGDTMRRWRDQLVNNAYLFDFPIHTPYYDLTRKQRQLLWSGNQYFEGLNSFFDYLESERRKIQYRVMKARYTGKTICSECGGSRLRKEALYVRVGGRNIGDLITISIDELIHFFDTLELDEYDAAKAKRIIIEIRNRLQYMVDVGLGYLTLDRLSSTLSGGESQRINLSTSLGSNLTGSLYILDEPSIGLHPRDTHRLIGVLKQLRDIGNTVIVVEHEEEVIRAADYIVDVGPEAGYLGGEIVYSGDLKGLMKCRKSLTADYLTGRKEIESSESRRAPSGNITLRGARENNLRSVNVNIPLGVMSCITGVSGSGKSSLVRGILYPALRREFTESGSRPGDFDGLEGDLTMLSAVEMVDQSPIGRSSRSNPVTYIKAYDEIRKLYSDLPYSRNTGLSASHFSFNIAGGRCEECQGEGIIKVSMQFMADVELECESCKGSRFKPEVLAAKYRGRSICEVLDMTVDAAIEFFGEDKNNTLARRVVERLSYLESVGLGYIKLGQSSSTLSGGEAQRVKLASFLGKDSAGAVARDRILFIFDEPTTGLHFHDINRLLRAFAALIERGHTIVVVEHNLDVIKCADYVIELGPEAGDRGGEVTFEGSPQDMMLAEGSYTGRYLTLRTRETQRTPKDPKVPKK